MTGLLAAADYTQPALWAVIIGWVMSVTLHEFAHGLVAYWGGDHTIRDRGGLTLNPFQYVDPLMSIALPIVYLLIGGIPLPGGATYVRRDLLRGRGWDSAVSAAGPAMNLILFGLLAIPLMPSFGWIPGPLSTVEWTTAQKFVAAMCFLQLFSVILNLFPIPPLDGFGIISPYLNPELRSRLTTPPTSTYLFLGFFMLLWMAPAFTAMIVNAMFKIMGPDLSEVTYRGMNEIFWSRR